MKMKQLANGLLVPDDDNAMKDSIDKFDPISPEELRENMILPINAALAKGIPPDQPAAIPVEAVARLCRTIMMMANTLTMTEQTLFSIINDETIPEDVRKKIKSILGPQVEKSNLFDDDTGEQNAN
jgi:hypothetical protein